MGGRGGLAWFSGPACTPARIQPRLQPGSPVVGAGLTLKRGQKYTQGQSCPVVGTAFLVIWQQGIESHKFPSPCTVSYL